MSMSRAEGKGQRAKVRSELTRASAFLTFAFCLLPFAFASGAEAALVRFSTGTVMSVESCQITGETATIVLRGGGQLIVPKAAVAQVLPDEYFHGVPEPLPAPPAVAAADDVHALVDRLAARYGVDTKLAHAVVAVESNYQPRAVSPKGAMGLMQLMPSVAQEYALDDPFDPEKNVDAGLRHLRGLLDRYADVKIALAAYNAGAAAVARYGGIPPFQETRDYVTRIMKLIVK